MEQSERVHIIETNRRDCSIARNRGAALARALLDDDDWLLPAALDSFWQLASEKTTTVWRYSGIRIFNEMGEILRGLNQGLDGDCYVQPVRGNWALIQVSLIKAQTYFGTENEDLCRRFDF